MARTKNFIDLSGKRFSRWRVLTFVGISKYGHAIYLCACDCGAQKKVKAVYLRDGRSTSCGCVRRELSSERLKKHGLSKHPLFSTWYGMMMRCYNTRNPAYTDYGARGIFVCERWKDVRNFICDLEGAYSPGLSIDRINNDGPYEINNIRWANASMQSKNRRSNVIISHNGRSMCLFDWARAIGMAPRTLWRRINSGWPIKDALECPLGHRR